MDEKCAGIVPEKGSCMNAAVTTGNHHCLRVLAFLGKLFVKRFVLDEFGGLPVGITLHKIGRKRLSLCHHILIFRLAVFIAGDLSKIHIGQDIGHWSTLPP
jgi:hypothetical protein